MDDMDCVRARDLFGAHTDGQAPAEDADALRAHLERCVACAREVAALDAVDRALRAVPLDGPTDDEWAALVARAQMAARPARWGRLVAAAVLAAAVPLGLAGWLGRRTPEYRYDVWTPGVDMEF